MTWLAISVAVWAVAVWIYDIGEAGGEWRWHSWLALGLTAVAPALFVWTT